MKTPFEIQANLEMWINTTIPLYIIEDIQNEAYNQALDDAAERAEVTEYYPILGDRVLCVDKQSILKLKK